MKIQRYEVIIERRLIVYADTPDSAGLRARQLDGGSDVRVISAKPIEPDSGHGPTIDRGPGT